MLERRCPGAGRSGILTIVVDLRALSRVFLERLPPSSAAKLRDEEALARLLGSALEAARRGFSTALVTDAAFVGHAAERLAGEDDMEGALADLHAADLLLACACLAADAAALAELSRRIDVESRAALRGLRASPDFADEVRSRLTERLLVGERGAPKLARYAGLGPLSAWLRVAALRTGVSLRRRDRREAEDPSRALLEAMDPSPDPEARLAHERYQEDLRAALGEAMARLSSRDRNLLRMYYAEGIKLDKLGTFYRVNASTISRWIARAREDILAHTRETLGARLKLSAAQVESLLGVAESLDVSLGGFLRRSAG